MSQKCAFNWLSWLVMFSEIVPFLELLSSIYSGEIGTAPYDKPGPALGAVFTMQLILYIPRRRQTESVP